MLYDFLLLLIIFFILIAYCITLESFNRVISLSFNEFYNLFKNFQLSLAFIYVSYKYYKYIDEFSTRNIVTRFVSENFLDVGYVRYMKITIYGRVNYCLNMHAVDIPSYYKI
ncbi:hypothetical protein V1477_014848 [Vespula maculifrons]|uniref:Uncharacterized protein n=1 Tax=Vespula maculifrons TaxID=7453 RepID=A0ABD2BIN1_VESMC